MAAGGHSTPLRERMLLTNSVVTGSTIVHHDTEPLGDGASDAEVQERVEAIMLRYLGRDGDAVCIAFDVGPSVEGERATVDRVFRITTTAAASIETEREVYSLNP